MAELEFDNPIDTNKVFIKLKNKDWELKYTFSTWAILEKEYGGMKELAGLDEVIENKPFETLPRLVWLGLVDKEKAEAEGLNDKNLLDEYGIKDIPYITKQFNSAIFGSLPEPKDEEKKAEMEA
jgi:hypothetical protein